MAVRFESRRNLTNKVEFAPNYEYKKWNKWVISSTKNWNK